MTNHGRVQSNVQPEALRIDDFSVWVASNITEVDLPNGDLDDPGTVKGWEYDLVQYDKDEYIQSIHDDLASTQEAVDFLLMNA